MPSLSLDVPGRGPPGRSARSRKARQVDHARMLESLRLFLGGIVGRFFWLVPGVVFASTDPYNTYLQRAFPQGSSLAAGLIVLGLFARWFTLCDVEL